MIFLAEILVCMCVSWTGDPTQWPLVDRNASSIAAGEKLHRLCQARYQTRGSGSRTPEDTAIGPGESLPGELQSPRSTLREHDLILCRAGVEELENHLTHQVDAV